MPLINWHGIGGFSPQQNEDTLGQGTGIHGQITDNPLLLAILDAGNYLRYGKSEGQRVHDVEQLNTPGVRDAAYTGPMNIFDPAAAERYTSAYDFGNMYHVPEFMQPALHEISGGGRRALNAVGFPGVGEERPELSYAEQLGMQRGSQAAVPVSTTASNPYMPLMAGLGSMFSGLGIGGGTY